MEEYEFPRAQNATFDIHIGLLQLSDLTPIGEVSYVLETNKLFMVVRACVCSFIVTDF
jgi:hypothetical protein